MILCSAILIIAFFFVVAFSMQLMNEFGPSFKESITGKVTYATIERNVTNATLMYMDKYYKNEVGTGTITVLTENLVDYGLLKDMDLVTSEKDNCRGYALVRKNNKEDLEVDAYIMCNDYTTKDFQNWRMGE